MAVTKTEQKYAISKGFAEVGTEEWLRECEALLASVPPDWNTVAIGKDRLKGLIDALRESEARVECLMQSGEEARLYACHHCSRTYPTQFEALNCDHQPAE